MYVSDKKEKISRLVEFIISITKKMKDTCCIVWNKNKKIRHCDTIK